MQVTHAFSLNNLYSKPRSIRRTESITTHGVDVGKIILYGIVIIILILTRLKWAKHGRKITKRKVKVETVFFSILGSIVIFDSFYDVGVPIFYLIPYLILFFGLQQYSYLHSNRLYIVLEGIQVGFDLCEGWNSHSFCICSRNNITHNNICLVHWQFVLIKSTRINPCRWNQQ